MKKILFGIALMVFSFVIEQSLNLEFFPLTVSAIGMIFAIVGLVEKNES